MFFDERRIHFLRDRVQRRLKACQNRVFLWVLPLLTSREGKTELIALLENLTVNETSFFRAKPQLELFQKTTLEELLHRKQRGGIGVCVSGVRAAQQDKSPTLWP